MKISVAIKSYVKLFLTAAVLLPLTWLSGCANSPDALDSDPFEVVRGKGYEIGESVSRVHNFKFSSWNYVNREALMITASPKRKYLVVFNHPCRSLTRAATLVTRDTTYSNSLDRLDTITVVDGMTDHERCPIGEIYEIRKLETTEKDG